MINSVTIVGYYCTKDVKIGVHGQLQQRTWQDEERFNRSIVEIRDRELELLSGRNGNQSSPEGKGSSERSSLFSEDDDVPSETKKSLEQAAITEKRRQPGQDRGCLLVCKLSFKSVQRPHHLRGVWLHTSRTEL